MKNKYEKSFFTSLVKKCYNLSHICEELNLSKSYGNRQTIKRYIEEYNIDFSHFKTRSRTKPNNVYTFEDIFCVNSTYSGGTTKLKEKLYKLELKFRICEKCGQTENWNGEHISLIIDHINGINNDNRLENLRILCPNCNATLDTHGGKNKNTPFSKTVLGNNKDHKNTNFCIVCGKQIDRKAIRCKKCDEINQRKPNRASKKDLYELLQNTTMRGIGKIYNVSDNTIRKWCKAYELPYRKGDIINFFK